MIYSINYNNGDNNFHCCLTEF